MGGATTTKMIASLPLVWVKNDTSVIIGACLVCLNRLVNGFEEGNEE